MAHYLLNNFIIKEYVVNALKEDIGYGDISTDYICVGLDPETVFSVALRTREDGIFCGEDVFRAVFDVLSEGKTGIKFNIHDGDFMEKGSIIAEIKGNPRHVLTGERLALNFVQRMSGIASYTRKFADVLEPYGVSIADTRKNTPNFRIFEKYAAKVGGARLHRFNLCDCIMLKDNHIALLGGSVKDAVKKVRAHSSHAHKIEVECDNYEQVAEAVSAGVDIIMLDNMSKDKIKKCVNFINKRAVVEVSGNVTLETLPLIANTGIDVISSSAIIAHAPVLDLGFDYLN